MTALCSTKHDGNVEQTVCFVLVPTRSEALRHTHFAMLPVNIPPVTVTTVGAPQAMIVPPSSSASLLLKVPPSMVTLDPPNSSLSPEQYT